jgi:hypothetical protein
MQERPSSLATKPYEPTASQPIEHHRTLLKTGQAIEILLSFLLTNHNHLVMVLDEEGKCQ